MITKLKGYTADAEILGEIYAVEFTGDALVIRGLELFTAGMILERLSDKSIAAVALPDATPKPVTQRSDGCKPGDVATPPLPDSLQKRNDAAKTDQASLPGTATPPAAKSAELPPPPPAAPPAASTPPLPEPAAAPPVDVPPEITNAQRLLEIVSFLKDKQGLKTAEEILAACVKYRAASPVLQRATNLEDRIKKMMEM